MRKFLRVPLLLSLLFLFGGWGNEGHRIINGKAVLNLPAEMEFFTSWKAVMEQHGSDADIRKGTDPAETPKHYIDIDNYPEFISMGMIPQDYDSVVSLHGISFVIDQGILPWTVLTTFDSLTASFLRQDYSKAVLFASDLGHYTADSHMPLHLTKNYNGQLTGQTGIHSRYESHMVNRYSSQITVIPDSALYIDNPSDFVFQFIYRNYSYVDSLLIAESEAKRIAGSSTSELYYQKLWELTQNMTNRMFSGSVSALTSLIYTSWVNAGKPSAISSVDSAENNPASFRILQNYPNPFNPSTNIVYVLPNPARVKLMIYDITGRVVSSPVDAFQSAGEHEYHFSGEGLAAGTYFAAASIGSETIVHKMLLLK